MKPDRPAPATNAHLEPLRQAARELAAGLPPG
ncbi:hypothetical protein FHR84_002797 [Actinopolyspora biskrensis]|uniref:Uncharacterized protein n=1 Tax=Actinopolyspora biskrensis TaxID=1470178 RepID=A0A852Z112_9ACTN|nr:hypothetical protein [Actinopolyspora biskrensis]